MPQPFCVPSISAPPSSRCGGAITLSLSLSLLLCSDFIFPFFCAALLCYSAKEIRADTGAFDQSKFLRTAGDYMHTGYTSPSPFHPPPPPVWGPHGFDVSRTSCPAVTSRSSSISAQNFPTSVLLQEQRDEHRPLLQMYKEEKTSQVQIMLIY